MVDAHTNFAYSTVATAPTPASSGTSLVVAAGEGALFPAVPFNATVWPAGANPLTSNAEIVRVTNISTDTFTITRTQESTSARSIVVGDQIAATVTAKTLTDVESGVVTLGRSALVYRYTVAGSDKASIDTGVDTADAGDNDWTGGDLLECYLYSRTDEAVPVSQLNLTFNNDGGGNYDRRRVQDPGSNAVAGAAAVAQANIFFNTCGASDSANYFGYARFFIPNYAGTTGYKAAMIDAGTPDATGSNIYLQLFAAAYRSTSAITRLKVIPNTAGKKLKVGTQLLIYKRLSS